jgi:hypothetical protein
MIKRHFVVVSLADGVQLHPLKKWLRDNPGCVPSGLHPDSDTSWRLRSALTNVGWKLEMLPDRVLLTQPAQLDREYPSVGSSLDTVRIEIGTQRQVAPSGGHAIELAVSSISLDRLNRPTDPTQEWYWEGNVVEKIADFLLFNGWSIVNKADTLSKQRGADIHASRCGKTLLLEAKGYPSQNFRDPRRAGQKKPTNPTNQAQHWYSHALLRVLRLQTKHPDATVALGFPDFPRYRALFAETQMGLAKLGIAMLTVRADGSVMTWGLGDQDVARSSLLTNARSLPWPLGND